MLARLAGSEASDTPPVAPLIDWQHPSGEEFGADPPGEAGTDLCGLGDGRPLGFLPAVSLSEAAVVGENLGYLAVDAQGRDVAAVLFGAAWRCAPRDQFLEWGDTSVESSCTGWPITRAF